MKKVKICFNLFNEPQEVELGFEDFGKYMACAFAEEANDISNPFLFESGSIPCHGFTDEIMDKYGEIPFLYHDEEYTLMLIIGDHSLEIHKKGEDDFEEYSNFHLSV
jgi:hypothetical protein